MGKRRAELVRQLREACDHRELVRVQRRDDFDEVDGFIVEVGEEWLLLAVLDPALVLDGHCALRLEDVTRVRHQFSGDLVVRALELRQQWPPTAPDPVPALNGVRELVTSMAGLSEMITVHLEADDPDVCFIGAAVDQGQRSLHLQEVNSRGAWAIQSSKYRLDRITRVEIGGRYEEALLAVAGAPPKGQSAPRH